MCSSLLLVLIMGSIALLSSSRALRTAFLVFATIYWLANSLLHSVLAEATAADAGPYLPLEVSPFYQILLHEQYLLAVLFAMIALFLGTESYECSSTTALSLALTLLSATLAYELFRGPISGMVNTQPRQLIHCGASVAVSLIGLMLSVLSPSISTPCERDAKADAGKLH
jgi:ABC-type amino acid transport system permease subunit